MKKFKFRLERMLQLKDHKEKEKQKILAEATQKVVSQESYLESIGQKRLNTQVEQRKFLTGKLNMPAMSMFSRFYLGLKKNEISGREMLRAYRMDQAKKRQELIHATKEKKIYEKLKERKYTEYYKDLELQQQKEQDELASQMMLHKKNPR